MWTKTPEEKTSKKARRQQRRVTELREEMRKDVAQLRAIIAGRVEAQSKRDAQTRARWIRAIRRLFGR